MPTLTDQQRQPLERPGISIALGAGAGCGKTTVLTERFVAALSGEGRLPLDRIVALTFTDKAAAELRGRVRAACRARLDEGDEPDYWRGVLRGLEAAPIGTFHTFCGEVVRRFAVRAGIDPGFAILHPSIAATCREEAVDTALRQSLRSRDRDLRDLAVSIGLDRVRDALVDLLGDRSAESLDRWAGTNVDELVGTWSEAFETKVRPAVLRRFVDGARSCLDFLNRHDLGHHVKMRERRERLLDLIPSVLHASDPALILPEIKEHARVQGGAARDKWPDPSVFDSCKATFDSLRKSVDTTLSSLKHDEASTLDAADLGLRLARLGAKARRDYARLKADRGALDFDDLLLTARDLLRDEDCPVRAELGAKFDLILVDEFQDTDPVQDEIVRRIAGDDLARGRLFLVGDFKQSIYGFRGAVPALFTQYRSEFPAEGQLPLTENFRSRPAILDFVNALFFDAFDGYEPLTPGLPDLLRAGQSAVVLAWPDARDEDAAKDDRNVGERRRAEAKRLARLVKSWIVERRQVVDKATRHSRPMKAGDVAILFRSNDAFEPFEQALADVGLDYHLTGGPGFFSRQEVLDLINLLTVLDDPHDSLALAGALRGPFFALSDEALFWLATVRPGDLAAGLGRCDEATLPDLSPRDRQRSDRAARLLGRWRSFKDREPIAGLVDRVLTESGFEAALIGEPLGDRKRANARKLVRMAREFDEQGGFTLADFVARLRADLGQPSREEQATTADEGGDAVRLLTVHKAKGLEFPVVIVPDVDRRPGPATSGVVLDPDLGPLVYSKAETDDEGGTADGSLGWLVHRELARRDDEAEALRVFYVATTRARDYLILSSSGDPAQPSQSPAMRLLVDRYDPGTGTFAGRLPDGWPDPSATVIRGTPPLPGGPMKTRRRRPPLLAIARVIESTIARGFDPAPAPATAPPALPFLSLDPASGLSPHAARLDRLVLATFLDPRSVRPGRLEEAAAEAGRRQSPMATPRLVAEAVDRLRGRLGGALGREIASAKEIRADLAWSVAWPPDSTGQGVIEGRLDLAYRDARGDWRVVNLSDQTASVESERLRLLLSAYLAPSLGLGRIAQAWRFAHGPEGGLSGESDITAERITACLGEIRAV